METYQASFKPDHNKIKSLSKICTKSIKGFPTWGKNTHLSDETVMTQLQENKQLYSQYHLFFFKTILIKSI